MTAHRATRPPIRPWVWALSGAATLGVASLTALIPLPRYVRGLSFATGWGTVPTLLFTGVSVAMALGVVVLLGLLARRHPRPALVAAFILYLFTRVALLAAVDAPVVSDWLAYHRLALGSLAGAPPIADQPMGYPILLGLAYGLGGVSAASAEALNLLASLITAIAVWRMVALTAGGVAAVVAVALLAVTPTHVLYTAIRGSETVFTTLLTVAAAVAVSLAVRLRAVVPGRVVALAVGLGLVLGVAAWVRPTALAVAPFLAFVPLVARRDAIGVRATVAVVAGVLIATAPVVALNAAYTGRVSPTTTLYGGWQLYVGANPETNGRWNPDDWDRLNERAPVDPGVGSEYAEGRFGNGPLMAAVARDRAGMELYRERISQIGLRFLTLLPAKFAYGWGNADDASRWAFVEGERSDLAVDFRIARAWSQAWWVVLLALGAVGLLAGARRSRALVLVTFAVVVPITAGLLILEAQGRYHEYAVPLVAAAAALAGTTSIGRIRAVRDR